MNKNYGFIPDVIEEDKHWVAGGSQTKMRGLPLNPSGDWTPYLPAGQMQFSATTPGGFDAEDCTTMGTQNAVETLMALLGYKANYSKRALAIASDTQPTGNSPHKVAETIRTILGELDESQLPFDPTAQAWTWATYYFPKPLTAALLKLANAWWQLWDFNHQWVLNGKEDPATQILKMKAALQRSPLGVGVAAWFMGPDGKYIRPPGEGDGHWVALVNFKDGEYWEIFDSYDAYLKQLDWNFGFTQVKEYSLMPHQQTISILAQILDLMGKILGIDALLIKQLPAAAGPVVTHAPAIIPPPAAPVAPDPIAPPKIHDWALAIQHQEGGELTDRNMLNDNPGNLRYTPYTKSLGATEHDADNFCLFPSYEAGLAGLCQFLTDAANDLLIPYKTTRTLKSFTEKYAQPPNDNYANGVAAYLKVDVNCDIKTLL